MIEKIYVYKIDGATACADMTIETKGGHKVYRFPEMDPDYKYAIFFDDMIWVSKDRNNFVVAFDILVGEETYTATDFKGYRFVDK